MKRFATWTVLSITAILACTNAADARGRRRGCHGSNGCHGSAHGCHGSVVRSNGCHGSVHASGCHGSVASTTHGRSSFYPSQPQGEVLQAPGTLPNKRVQGGVSENSTGTLEFRAPANAQIWVDGQLVNRQGDAWRYTTPELRSGQRQSYEVKARWSKDGRDFNQTRNVTVEPGGRMTVDFTVAEPPPPRNELIPQPGKNNNTPPND